MSAPISVKLPGLGTTAGIVLALVPAAVVVSLALFLNWGR